MKYITTIFVILFSTLVYCQDLPKNANIIIVKGISFDNVVNSLLDSGYIIEKMDKEYKTVKTEYRKFCKDCIPEYSFDIRVKDSTATIRGKWRSNGDIFSGITSKKDEENALVFEIINEKSKVPKEIFKVMNKFALSLKGEISYKVEK